jgi:hypothetical protein
LFLVVGLTVVFRLGFGVCDSGFGGGAALCGVVSVRILCRWFLAQGFLVRLWSSDAWIWAVGVWCWRSLVTPTTISVVFCFDGVRMCAMF